MRIVPTEWRLWTAGLVVLLVIGAMRYASNRSVDSILQNARPPSSATAALNVEPQPTDDGAGPTAKPAIESASSDATRVPGIDPKTFACRADLAELRISTASRNVPTEILPLLACGRTSEAVDELLALAQAGDRRAFSVLAPLWLFCSGKPSPGTHASWDGVLLAARQAGASIQVQERLAAILAAKQKFADSPDRHAACERVRSAEVIGSIALGRARAEEERLRKPGEDLTLDMARKIAASGSDLERFGIAEELLAMDSRPENRAEAVRQLKIAAATLPSAKTRFALCILDTCEDGLGAPADAHRLLVEAALAGDVGALDLLATGDRATPDGTRLDLPESERYAWQQFRERLATEGCLGSSRYIEWATKPYAGINLYSLTPADDAAARARSEDLIRTRLRQTRAAMRCDA